MFGRTCHLSWMNDAIAQCLVPGSSMTFRSRWTVFGQSRRNDGKRIGQPAQRCLFRGRPGARGGEREPAARAAGILRLQQDVAVLPPLAAELDRVLVHQLGQRSHDVPGRLGPIPRLAGREAKQRIAKRAAAAADADLRDAARVLVQVRAGNADVGARRQTVARGDRRVAVVIDAAADVEHQRLAEHARPGPRRAVAGVRAGAREAAVGWARRTGRTGPDRTRPAA